MITEDLAVELKPQLGQIIGINDVKILTQEEYLSQTEAQEWFDSDSDSIILQLNLYGNPENFIIQQISTVCFHTQSQVHYISDDETVNASTAYICPTTNEFHTLETLLSNPNPRKLIT